MTTEAHLTSKNTQALSDSLSTTFSTNARVAILKEATRENTDISQERLQSVSIGTRDFISLGVWGTDTRVARLWYMLDPPTGAQTVDLSRDGVADRGVVSLSEVTGDELMALVPGSDNGDGNSGSSISATVGASVPDGGLSTAVFFHNVFGEGWTIDAPATELHEKSNAALTLASVVDLSTGSVTISGSHVGTSSQGIAVAAFQPRGLPPDDLTVTDDVPANELQFDWANKDSDAFRKRLFTWPPGSDPTADPGHGFAILPPSTESYTIERPSTGGTHTFGIGLLADDDDQNVLGVSNLVEANLDLLTQEGFRFRNDDGDEAGASWRDAQDANSTAVIGENFRLRVLIDSDGDIGSKQYMLRFRKVGDPTWKKVPPG